MKAGKKMKAPDKRPSRIRYWMSRHLERNKVRNLMRHSGMDYEEAMSFWHKSRKMRMKSQAKSALVV